MVENLPHLIAELRAAGGDGAAVEVKSAAGGLPASLTPTLSALANLPGGGTIILGLDERTGFRPVPLADPQALKQGLALKARSFTPPVRLTIEDALVDGSPVIVAKVHECDRSAKPCRVTATGASYLRGYDGDFRLSALEEQAFLSGRQAPMFDREPVEDATFDDLDPELIMAFTSTVRGQDAHGLGRFTDDTELLRRAGVIDADRRPTVAGLLALGFYPQQWFPRYAVQAAAEPLPEDPAGSRARNQATFTGPIPRMLDQAMLWARQTFDVSIVAKPDGTVHDRYSYPLVAFRELIANALVHRDLDHWSAGLAVEVRQRRDRLVITNPGGLYGITADRLGHDAVTSARNARLVTICQYVRSPETGARVIEALATGIPTVNAALIDAGLPPAHYIDAGVRFTVVLYRPTSTALLSSLNAVELRVYDALATGQQTVKDLQAALGLTAPNIRKALRALRSDGLVQQIGGRGQFTAYQRVGE
ncbi:ATP-binding protein [Planomonospora parontospora]|uniref:ATP-binding protein n=1 Tax=Planomonospora parontospora TaxID=58119 RepID=UPI0019435AB7|nr:ATP-binding protein [Planomonospora parontospora]GGL05781.1 dihydroorotate dehydrogenase [Planomonospora parontospora subsp. antibiotica]GII14274.1 dihydroorotate dehydrogenase [Planomonospora parontospora subsp. antibiotica]